MRLRIRGPNGQSTAILSDDATVEELEMQIREKTSIKEFDVRYGYPPKTLSLDSHPKTSKLLAINIKLDGEQLIVSEKPGIGSISQGTETRETRGSIEEKLPSTSTTDPTKTISSSRASKSIPRSAGQPPPLSLSRNAPPMDPPELPLPSHASTLVLRIMPDDNSCLFRAFNTAFFGPLDNMQSLRSIVAQTILADPVTYSGVVLEKQPDDYCRWIQTADAWGGAIELDILSRHFDLEICSVDVQTLRVDRYNEGRPGRCILVYSGIHYDTIALSPSDPPYESADAPPEFDTKIFEAGDEGILEKAVELCKVLQGQHYFTDTAAFSVRCNVCGGVFTGEKGATEHAKQTGHYDFGEAG